LIVTNAVHTFEVGVKGAPWPPARVNHRTPGKAKSEYLREVRESWPDIGYTDLTVRKMRDNAFSSQEFIRVATYRGLPDARCGQRVKAGESRGTIVGYNSSANFNILFDDDDPKWPGLILNVHPHGIVFEQEG
jgi:hypothetical protein